MNVRNKVPEKDNKYYLKKPFGYNPCILGNPDNRLYKHSVLADCTGAVVGRFNELCAPKCKYLTAGYPGDYLTAANKQGLEIGATPRPGCVIVMLKPGTKYGHVICVEKQSGGKYYTFESGWNYKKGKYINNRWISKSNNFGMSSDYEFAGCIFNPNIDPYDIPPEDFSTRKEPKGVHVKFVQWVLVKENCYAVNTNAEIDGSAGKRTQEAIKVYQKRYGLTVDGIAGKNTCAQMIKDHAIV